MKVENAMAGADTIAAEACAWIAQLETGEVSREDLDALREWLKRSPRHLAEMRRYAHLWDDLNGLAGMAEAMDAAIAEQNRLALPGLFGRAPRRLVLPAAATAAAVLFAFAALYLLLPFKTAKEGPLFVATAVGEQREVRLPDGSSIAVNTGSELEIDYGGADRKVRLLKGEALFDVAPDASRPFIVYAGGRTVRAVGTAFAVRMDDAGIEVTVTEGVVELASIPAMADPAAAHLARYLAPIARVAAGQKAILDSDSFGLIENVPTDKLRRDIAWTDGTWDFSGEALSKVIAEVNRYSPLKIVIRDPEIADIEFGGVFKIGETASLLGALEEGFAVSVEKTADGTVYLRSAKRSGVPAMGEVR